MLSFYFTIAFLIIFQKAQWNPILPSLYINIWSYCQTLALPCPTFVGFSLTDLLWVVNTIKTISIFIFLLVYTLCLILYQFFFMSWKIAKTVNYCIQTYTYSMHYLFCNNDYNNPTHILLSGVIYFSFLTFTFKKYDMLWQNACSFCVGQLFLGFGLRHQPLCRTGFKISQHTGFHHSKNEKGLKLIGLLLRSLSDNNCTKTILYSFYCSLCHT